MNIPVIHSTSFGFAWGFFHDVKDEEAQGLGRSTSITWQELCFELCFVTDDDEESN
jgi:hypothetical protein